MDAQGPRKGKKVQGRKALSFEILWEGLETIRNNLEIQKESSSHYTLKSNKGQRETSPSTRQVLSELKQNLTFVHSWFWGAFLPFLGDLSASLQGSSQGSQEACSFAGMENNPSRTITQKLV